MARGTPSPQGDSLFSAGVVVAPLAARMRPLTLDEYAGQQHILAPGRPLRRAIDSGTPPSAIFHGPPGTGKTTLARLIARVSKAQYVELSAMSDGVAKIRTVVDEAKQRLFSGGGRTIVFVDEIHRLNKGQQDALLPHVEDGTVICLSATTENPSFSVNAALLSRLHVFPLKELSVADLEQLVRRALADRERGLGMLELTASDEAIRYLADAAGGDARAALTALDSVAQYVGPQGALTLEVLQETTPRRAAKYDKGGDLSHGAWSALHKSLRNGFPDGALYWAARMIQAGEDPMVLFRRAIAMASEDIGMADSRALLVAVAARDAYMQMGAPEGLIPMAHMLVYLATAPKSNSAYAAWGAAQAAAAETPNAPIPMVLQNAPTKLMQSQGYAHGYRSAHDTEVGAVPGQQSLPDVLKDATFYTPHTRGEERRVAERLAHWRAASEG